MSRETQVLRPYRVDRKLGMALRESVLMFGGDDKGKCTAGERIVIDDNSYTRRTANFQWAEEQGFEKFKADLCNGAIDTGIDVSNMRLVVTVRSGYLKISERLFSLALSELHRLRRIVPLPSLPDGDPDRDRPAAFQADTHGATVDAYVVLANQLNRDVEDNPLRPWRSGTWLAHESFRIVCQDRSDLFKPQPLTEEDRRRLKLPANTIRYVEIDSSHDLTEPMDQIELPTVWVDEELLQKLSRDSGHPAAKLLQLQLVLDFVSAAIMEFSRQAKASESDIGYGRPEVTGYSEIRDSLIGKIVRLVSGRRASKQDKDTLLKKAAKKPTWFIASAEHAIGLKKPVDNALRMVKGQ